MFDFKNKKGGRAATATLSPTTNTPVATRRSPLEKVYKIGKTIRYSFSITLGRKTSGQPSPTNQSISPVRLPSDTPTATTGSHHNSEACITDPNSPSSSKSTAATEHSLPRLDCGEIFFVPGISPSPETHSDPEQAPIQKQDSLPVHSSVPIACHISTNTVNQTRGEIPAKPEQLRMEKEKTHRLRSYMKAFWKKIAFLQRRAPRFSKFDSNEPKRNDSAIGSGTPSDTGTEKQSESTHTDTQDSDENDRCDWDTIDAIPNEKYCELVKACNLTSSPTASVEVVRFGKGTYNLAAFVNVCEGDQTHKYIVRVPGHGTLEHWTEEDSYVLKNEAQLIEYIRKNTTAPVAQIIHYSTGHDNALGFPYILMTMLPGMPAWKTWFPSEDYPDGLDEETAFLNADVPPPHIEKKRIKFLRSLAQAMTQIGSLEFNAIGALTFDDDGNLTGIGPTCHWTDELGDEAFKRPAAATTEEYFQARLTAKLKQLNDKVIKDIRDDNKGWERRAHEANGLITVFCMLFRESAFRGRPGETFTLHHNDLDLQNILCDDEGNVTGIIDWDNAMTAPRCIGATAVPMFLRHDWFPPYIFNLHYAPYMAWNYENYREIYASAIVEASDAQNAEFTVRSALYQAAAAVVTQGGDEYDLVRKLLKEIPHLRVGWWQFIEGLGQGGWDSARILLEKNFARIFEPVMPPEGLLEALDEELEMQTTWWSCCDELIELYEAEKEGNGDEEEDGAEEAGHDTAVVSG